MFEMVGTFVYGTQIFVYMHSDEVSGKAEGKFVRRETEEEEEEDGGRGKMVN